MRRRTVGTLALGATLLLVVTSATVMTRSEPEAPPTLDAVIVSDEWRRLAWSDIDVAQTAGIAWSEVVGALRAGDKALVWGIAEGDGRREGHTALWETSDGLSWTAREIRIDRSAGYTPSTIVPGPGGYLALGYSRPADRVAVAGSVDGVDWATLFEPAPETEPWFATSTKDGYVIAGTARGRSTTWSSRDGTVWTEIPVADAPPTGLLLDLETFHGDVYIAGRDGGDIDLKPLLYHLEGDAWVPQLLPSHDAPFGWASGIEYLVSFDAGILAVGRTGPAEDCRGASVAAGRPIADVGLPCQFPPQGAWVSEDGDDWQDATLPVLPNVVPENLHVNVVAGGPGLIGIAAEPRLDTVRYSVWTSGDGKSWDRIADGMPLQPGEYASQFVSLPGRLIAVGAADSGIGGAWTAVASP